MTAEQAVECEACCSRPAPVRNSTVDAVRNVYVETWHCRWCRAPLGYGPASADTEQVEVERRAAELAAEIANATRRRSRFSTWEKRDVRYSHIRNMDGAEIAGHMIYQSNSAKQPEQPGEWAGYLAAAIGDDK